MSNKNLQSEELEVENNDISNDIVDDCNCDCNCDENCDRGTFNAELELLVAVKDLKIGEAFFFSPFFLEVMKLENLTKYEINKHDELLRQLKVSYKYFCEYEIANEEEDTEDVLIVLKKTEKMTVLIGLQYLIIVEENSEDGSFDISIRKMLENERYFLICDEIQKTTELDHVFKNYLKLSPDFKLQYGEMVETVTSITEEDDEGIYNLNIELRSTTELIDFIENRFGAGNSPN